MELVLPFFEDLGSKKINSFKNKLSVAQRSVAQISVAQLSVEVFRIKEEGAPP